MDLYHVWCNLRPGVSDVGFCDRVAAYLGKLQAEGLIAGHRVTRRKLGFGPRELGEFHVAIEVRDLAQLDQAFATVAERSGVVEGLHQAVNSLACDLTFALYRDFPDPNRKRGEEKF